nr:metallophosphoesterase domain-containing protein 1 [Quercus suber]
MSSSTMKTRILIISDTHCAGLFPGTREGSTPVPPFCHPLPSADLLIHCGDLTHTGALDEYHQTLDMLSCITAPVKLVIAGNHDLSLDRTFVFNHLERDHLTEEQGEFKVKQARDLWVASDGRATMEGITFLDEGHHHVQLRNGAKINIYASPYTPEFYDWGFPYERHQDRFNAAGDSLSDVTNISVRPVEASGKETIDIMITHGPPYRRLDQTSRGEFAGCPHTLRALMRSRPLLHCFGHIHEGWGAEVVQWQPSAIEAALRQPSSMSDWKDNGHKAAIARVEQINVDLGDAKARHAAYLDLSSSGKALEKGSETALINAAIMDVTYKPSNAPWLIDIDLPVT